MCDIKTASLDNKRDSADDNSIGSFVDLCQQSDDNNSAATNESFESLINSFETYDEKPVKSKNAKAEETPEKKERQYKIIKDKKGREMIVPIPFDGEEFDDCFVYGEYIEDKYNYGQYDSDEDEDTYYSRNYGGSRNYNQDIYQ